MEPPPQRSRLQSYRVETPLGPVFYKGETSAPKVLMIHGFMREPLGLYAWRERIPGVGFVHLPGCGGATDLTEVSLQAWIASLDAMMARFPTPPLLIGESLGAVIAMSVRSRAVIAIEPLLSIHKLWPIHATLRQFRTRGVVIPTGHDRLFDDPLHWVLERIRSPTMVIAGDEPLLPPRDMDEAPSLLSDEDFATYAAHPLVQAQRISGGHNLLDHHPDGVMTSTEAFMRDHGYL